MTDPTPVTLDGLQFELLITSQLLCAALLFALVIASIGRR